MSTTAEPAIAQVTQLAISAAGTLDPEGLQEDVEFLIEDKWTLRSNFAVEASWEKGNGALHLAAKQSQDNQHRVVWELAIHAKATRIGYASDVLRPGDLTNAKLMAMIKKALKAGEDELHSWEDALAEARRQLGI
jgi:hypothetical protein